MDTELGPFERVAFSSKVSFNRWPWLIVRYAITKQKGGLTDLALCSFEFTDECKGFMLSGWQRFVYGLVNLLDGQIVDTVAAHSS